MSRAKIVLKLTEEQRRELSEVVRQYGDACKECGEAWATLGGPVSLKLDAQMVAYQRVLDLLYPGSGTFRKKSEAVAS